MPVGTIMYTLFVMLIGFSNLVHVGLKIMHYTSELITIW